MNLLTPDNLVHAGFELADRRHRQHILGLVFVALCTLVLQTNMGQAGIGAIDERQVSNNRPIPPDAVIAQPQMLFLFLDHHLNRPSFQITADNLFHRGPQVIGHQRCHGPVPPASGEHDFNGAQFVHRSDALNQFVPAGFPQSLKAEAYTGAVQQIPAVRTDFMFLGIDRKPAIGLADADIMPVSLFADIRHGRTQIKGVEQNGELESVRDAGIQNHFAGQVRQLLEPNADSLGIFFFDIKPRGQWNSHAAIIQAGFDNGMARAVFAGGMMMEFADRLHLFGTLDRLGIINDHKTVVVPFFIPVFEHRQRLGSNDGCFIKGAAPQELAMIGPVGTASEQVNQSLNRTAVADADSYDQRTIIGIT